MATDKYKPPVPPDPFVSKVESGYYRSESSYKEIEYIAEKKREKFDPKLPCEPKEIENYISNTLKDRPITSLDETVLRWHLKRNAVLDPSRIDKEYREYWGKGTVYTVPPDLLALALEIKSGNTLEIDDKVKTGVVGPDLSIDAESLSNNVRLKAEFAASIVKSVRSDPDFASALFSALAANGIKLSIDGVKPIDNISSSPAAPDAVPSCPVIPADTPFWKDRSKDDARSPAQFIQDHYGEMRDGTWHHCGMTSPDLLCDKELYKAYSQWKTRHPEDALEFAPGGKKSGRPRLAGTDERRRTSDREAKAQKQKQKRENTHMVKMSHGPT